VGQLTQEGMLVVVRLERKENEGSKMIEWVIAVGEHVSYFFFIDISVAKLFFLFLLMVCWLL
jgi:hypothetical protein